MKAVELGTGVAFGVAGAQAERARRKKEEGRSKRRSEE
jgi:hypothetical protein